MNDAPPEFDDLEAILTPGSASPPPALHDAILLRTGRVLQHRLMIRRVAKAGAVAAVFLAGIGIGRETLIKPQQPVFLDLANAPQVIVVPMVIPVPVPAEAPSSAGPIASSEPAAAQAELLAEQADDRGEAARLYRLAGDKYLNDVQDYRNAARCYRLYLANAGDKGLTPETADTWLLTSLKNSAFKEKFDVSKTDG